MNDAFGMRGVERVGDLDAQREQSFYFQRSASDAVLESQAVQILHGDEGLAMLVVNFVDGADVGMIQRGRGLGFALKTREGLWISGDFVGQEL